MPNCDRFRCHFAIHHSDRGSQYCAYDYRVIQEQFGLKTSMSRKGNCYDNAPMESFRGTLKNESLSHYRFKSRDEAISVIREYIEIFYNRQRRHSRLGNISPAAFRENIIRWLLKKRTNDGVRYCQYTSHIYCTVLPIIHSQAFFPPFDT